MPEVATSITNRAAWVDLASPNIEASKQFYSQVFGWSAQQMTGPEGGNYHFFLTQGKDLGGVGSIMDPGQQPAWLVYFGTDDIEKSARAIRDAGGEIVMGPMDVMGAGQMCIFRDPTGAHAALWQAGTHHGASIMHEPGSMDWVELNTRDLPRAKQFYMSVFGWGEESGPMGPGMPDYTQWKLGSESVGGAMDMPAMVPADVPSHWICYFQVQDLDRTAAAVKQAGGQLILEATPYPGGRFVIASDPHGAVFAVMQAG